MWRESRAAAAVTVDLFNSAADIIVPDVQHVEARTCAVVHQGGAVQKTKSAFRKCSLQRHKSMKLRLRKLVRDKKLSYMLHIVQKNADN